MVALDDISACNCRCLCCEHWLILLSYELCDPLSQVRINLHILAHNSGKITCFTVQAGASWATNLVQSFFSSFNDLFTFRTFIFLLPVVTVYGRHLRQLPRLLIDTLKHISKRLCHFASAQAVDMFLN